MAFTRSAVRSRLAPPIFSNRKEVDDWLPDLSLRNKNCGIGSAGALSGLKGAAKIEPRFGVV